MNRPMRILLVNPPRSPHNAILDHASPQALPFIHRKLIGPPMGLLLIAATVRDQEVSILEMKGEYDLRPDAPSPEVLLAEWMARLQPDIVGVSMFASETPAGLAILREARRLDPDVLTLAGGLQPQLRASDVDDPAVDVVYLSTSPWPFRALVLAYAAGKGRAVLSELDGVGELLIREEGQLRPTRAGAKTFDLAGKDYPVLDRSLLNRWNPTYRVGKAPWPLTYLHSSLGCPYPCTFCAITPPFGGAFFQRSVEDVVAELATLQDYPVIRFADANTVVSPALFERLFDRIAAEGFRQEYVMDIRADTAARYPHVIEKMARAGLKVVICGVESPKQDELDAYDKRLDADAIPEAIRVFTENDVQLRANYVVPSNYEEPDFVALEKFASRHPAGLAGYTILTPLPGTPYYKSMLDAGEIVDHDLGKYNFFNSVTRSQMPLEKFYERVASLWLVRRGEEVI